MKKLLLAALAAITMAFSFTAAPTLAQNNYSNSAEVDVRTLPKGKWGKDIINPQLTVDQMASVLRQGNAIIEGTKMQGTKTTFSRMNNEITITNVGRAYAGVGGNFHTIRVIKATPQGLAIFNEKGEYLTLVADSVKVENAAGRWATGLAALPAAFANGGLQSLACNLIGPCGQQGPQFVNLVEATSGSWSNAQQSNHQAANAAANATAPAGGCGAALCVPRP